MLQEDILRQGERGTRICGAQNPRNQKENNKEVLNHNFS
jgi:hypothetical protein